MSKFMSIMGELKAVQSATDLRINAFNKKGKKLDSFTFIEGDDFELDFKTNKALRRAKRGKVRLQVEDLNGDESNFTLESGEQADFEPDSFIKTFKIMEKPSLNKDLRLPYTVIENQVQMNKATIQSRLTSNHHLTMTILTQVKIRHCLTTSLKARTTSG